MKVNGLNDRSVYYQSIMTVQFMLGPFNLRIQDRLLSQIALPSSLKLDRQVSVIRTVHSNPHESSTFTHYR